MAARCCCCCPPSTQLIACGGRSALFTQRWLQLAAHCDDNDAGQTHDLFAYRVAFLLWAFVQIFVDLRCAVCLLIALRAAAPQGH